MLTLRHRAPCVRSTKRHPGAATINSVGLQSWCNLLEGQMALMDKKVSEAKERERR